MRARLAAVLAATAAICGCNQPQTSLLVTLSFDSATHHPTSLTVGVTVLHRNISMPVTAPGHRALQSGDTFVVLLPDAAAGQTVMLDVTTGGDAPVLSGHAEVIARLHVEEMLTLPLGVPSSGDGGVDLAIADAASDASATRDLTAGDAGDGGIDAALDASLDGAFDAAADGPSDAAPPDQAMGCTPACANSTEITCTDGGMSVRSCVYGCDGNGKCVRPDDCTSPGDISAGGTFNESTSGYADDATGSCGGAGGVDAVTSLTTNDWRTVLISTAGTTYSTILYSRLACVDAATELPLAGPCAGANPKAMGTTCSANFMGMTSSQLVICNLPPNVPIYTWLDSKGLGGKYTLQVILSQPASLNTCPEAGNLLDGNNRTFPFTTAGKMNAFTNGGGGNCGDNGFNSPDAVFFIAVPVKRTYTFTAQGTFKNLVYIRNSCGGADLACQASNPQNASALTVTLPPGLYYVIVDGQGGASGMMTINVQ